MRLLIALTVLEVLIAFVLLYSAGQFLYRGSISLGLLKHTKPFQDLSDNYGKTLLVLGDSTGVGLGATEPGDTVAGLLARGMGATYTENRAVSGAVVADLPSQMKQMALAHYDTILLQIGANDIIGFSSASSTVATLAPILDQLTSRADHIYWMSAGNVGGATIFPFFMRPFYTALTIKYHTAFSELAREKGITYINLYTPPAIDPFTLHPEIYLAGDGLHPSSAGYTLFYKRLVETAGIQ